MSRPTILKAFAWCCACSLLWACPGTDRDVDTVESNESDDQEVDYIYDYEIEDESETGDDASVANDEEGDDTNETLPDDDAGDAQDEDAAEEHDGSRDDTEHELANENCLDECAPCDFDTDICCGNYVCQDSWNENHDFECLPVVPPPPSTCPDEPPANGTSCDELAQLCRYHSQVRCKCTCSGWQCPFEGENQQGE